jgi:hypothetical protein
MRNQKKTPILSYFLILTILALSEPGAFAEVAPNREIAKAWAEYYLENREFNKASDYLQEHLSKDPKDPDALRLLGVTYRMTGKWDKAEAALKRSAELLTGVDQGAVLYLLADSQLHAGQVSQAQQTLNDVAQIPGLSASAKIASAKAVAGMTLPPLEYDPAAAEGTSAFSARPWNMSVNVSSGYDTNVLLLPDSQTAGLNPATAMVTTGAQADYSSKIFGRDFSSNLSASYTKNFNDAAVSFDNVPVSLGLEWTVPGAWAEAHRLSFTQQGSATFVNTAGMGLFSTAAGAGLKGTIWSYESHSLDLNLPVVHNWYPGVPITSSADDRTGFNIAPSLTHRHGVLGLPVYETISYTHQFASGPNYVSTAYLASAGVSIELPKQVMGNLSIAGSKTTYPENTSGRSETKLNWGLEFSRKFNGFVPLTGSLAYGMEDNSSTIETATYLKHSFILKVNYEVQ